MPRREKFITVINYNFTDLNLHTNIKRVVNTSD